PAGAPADGEQAAAVEAALAELRRRAVPERVVLFASTDAARLAARCAGVDGLVLVSPRLLPHARPGDLDVFAALHEYVGSLLVLGAGDTLVQGPDSQALAGRAASWLGANPGRHLEMAMADGPRA